MKYICNQCETPIETYKCQQEGIKNTRFVEPCTTCFGEEYDNGHTDGKEEGYNEGYTEGLEEGSK